MAEFSWKDWAKLGAFAGAITNVILWVVSNVFAGVKVGPVELQSAIQIPITQTTTQLTSGFSFAGNYFLQFAGGNISLTGILVSAFGGAILFVLGRFIYGMLGLKLDNYAKITAILILGAVVVAFMSSGISAMLSQLVLVGFLISSFITSAILVGLYTVLGEKVPN